MNLIKNPMGCCLLLLPVIAWGQERKETNTNLNVNYHYFSTTAKVDGPEKNYKKDLGSEIDFQIDYQLMKDVKLSAGYSFMLGSETMDLVKDGSHDSWQDWGWIFININPNILFVKW